MTPAVVAAVLGAGVVGAVLRYGTSRFFAGRSAFPVAVLVVNVVGSAVAGAVVAAWTAGGVSTDARLILVTGFCGGLTTFSTFSVETVQLIVSGKRSRAMASVGANLVIGIGAAAIAWAVTTAAVA